jgi:hypothetical protein
MSREEAYKESLEKGVKLRHIYFSSHEWVKILPGGEVELEDGVKCPQSRFDGWRREKFWDDGWEIVKE